MPRWAVSKEYRRVHLAAFHAHSWLVEREAGLGRIGKAYPRGGAPAEAVQRFQRSPTETQERELRIQLGGAIVLLLVVLGVIGWAFTL